VEGEGRGIPRRNRFFRPALAVGLVLFYWCLESVLDVMVFRRSTWDEAFLHPDSNELWMRLTGASLLVAFFLLGAWAQIRLERERRLAHHSLRESADHLMEAQARIEAVTAATAVIIATVDKDLRYTFFNRGYADEIRRLTGKELHLGDNLGDLLAEMPGQQQAALQAWRTTLQGETSTKTVEFGDPSRYRRVYSVRHTPLRDGAGAIIGAGEVAWDITEREQSRREAEEVTQFSANILESISDAFFSLDEGMVITSFNSEAERVLDRRREDVLGRGLFDVFPEARGSIFEERYAHALKTREPLHFEVHFEVPPLANWYEVRIYPNKNGISVFFQVITGRKEAKMALRKSEEKYRILFENLSEGFALYELLYDEDGRPADWRVLEVNDAYERHTGISREQVMGRRVGELFPEAIPEYLPRFSAVVATQAPIEWDTFSKALGRHFRVLTFPAGPDRFASTLSDTTLLREAQSKVESLARFPLENPHPVMRVTMEGAITYANPSSADLLAHWGCSPGDPIPQEVYRMMEESIRGSKYKEFDVPCGDRFFSLTFTPHGDAEYINVYGRDITTKREAEQRLKASLYEKEVLLREVHHRVKNNLQVISTLLDLHATTESDPRVLAAFRDSQARVKSIALVHGMLCRTENLSRVDLRSYIGDLVQNLASAHALPQGEVKLEFQLGDVEMDLERAVPCGLIINELVANAFEHAFSDGRRGTIRVELEREPDGTIRLSVADDGTGFPGVDQSGEQPTLGLRLVGLLARQLRGKIEEERGAGTRVTLRFPSTSEKHPT
jgi:PAS domain S-box-containing protein